MLKSCCERVANALSGARCQRHNQRKQGQDGAYAEADVQPEDDKREMNAQFGHSLDGAKELASQKFSCGATEHRLGSSTTKTLFASAGNRMSTNPALRWGRPAIVGLVHT